MRSATELIRSYAPAHRYGVYTITAAQKFFDRKDQNLPIDASGFSAIITHTDASTITVQTFDGDGPGR